MVLIEPEKTDFEPRKRARRRALQAIYQWQLTEQDPKLIHSQFVEEQNMNGVDVDYFGDLLEQVTSRVESLDEQLASCLDRDLTQVDGIERAVLRLGAYELLHHPELPFRVIIDESVDLARRFGSQGGHAYVNGVLDRAAREWRKEGDAGKESGD